MSGPAPRRGRWPRWAGGATRVVSGSAVGQGLVILSYPVLTRLYDPDEFGLLAVFAALVGPLAVASTGALQAAIPIPREDREAVGVAYASLAFVVGTAAFLALLTPVAGPLSALLGVPRLAGFWWLVPLTVLMIGTYTVLSQWMVRTESYGALGRRNVLQGVGQVGTQVGLGLTGVRPVGLLLGLGVGRLVALGGLLSRQGLLRQQRPDRRRIGAAFSRFRRFPQLSMPSKLLNAAGLDVPLLLVAATYGDARAGLLGLTVRVVGAPTTVVGQALQQVFTGRLGAMLRARTALLGAAVRREVRRLVLVGAAPAAVLLTFGPGLFGAIFGADWVEAGEFARYLALAYLAQFVMVPVSATLYLLERQGRDLAWASTRLGLTAGGPLACALAGAPVAAAVAATAAGHVLSYGLLYVLCVRAADASDAQVTRPGPS